MNKLYLLIVLLLTIKSNSFAISVERNVFPNEIKKGQSIIVSITVKKEGEEGFAKLMESIPNDFKAEELNSATGNFICEDGKLRIIWLTMPDGKSFRAEYKLVYEGSSIGSFKLDGKFYFVKDGKRSEYNLSNTSFKISKETDPMNEIIVPKITTKSIEPKESEIGNVAVSNSKSKSNDVSPKENNEIKTLNTSDEESREELNKEVVKTKVIKSEVVFKVQLGVFSREKDLEIFGNLPEVHFVKAGNLYKYYSGKYTSEYEARSNIDAAKNNGFTGAFLVKFKDGNKL
jgi:hypothetical protein